MTNQDGTPPSPGSFGAARRSIGLIVPFVLFVLSIWAVHRELAGVSADMVVDALEGVGAAALALALVLAVAGFAAGAAEEPLAFRALGRAMPLRVAFGIGFVANAVGQAVGLSALSSAAVRWRAYASREVTLGDVGFVSAFVEGGFALGVLAGGGLVAVFDPAAGQVFGLGAGATRILGLAALALVASYPVACLVLRRPLAIGGMSLGLPGPGAALAHIALATVDLAAAGLVFVALAGVPAEAVGPTLLAFYAAAAIGALSAIPAGLGAFEAAMLAFVPAPAGTVLAALLLYRAIVTLLPLALSGIAVGIATRAEAAATLSRSKVMVERVLAGIAPPALAALVAVAGVVLLLSGASPALDQRLALLERWLPLPVVEVSHLAGSLMGFFLLILARGLVRRLSGAYSLTMAALGLGILASLFKGGDAEEAVFLAITAAALYLSRGAFYRTSRLSSLPFSPGWVLLVAVAFGASVWLGLFAYRDVAYSNELFWEFAIDSNAPRFLRATVLVAVVAVGFALYGLMRRGPTRPGMPTGAEIAEAAAVLETATASEGFLALTGDKHLLFTDDRKAFLMYGIRGRSFIAFGDPVGPERYHGPLIRAFQELCDGHGVRPVFYQVDGRGLERYVDLGFSFLKLGEEAHIELATFELKGKIFGNLRNARSRAQRDGLVVEVIAAEGVPGVLAEVKAVSDAWLASKGAREKGFTLGFFSEAYLTALPLAVVREGEGGRIIAFANLLGTADKGEVSIDLMRYLPETPNGTMDFLMIEIAFWAKAAGFRWFNLGLAPLSGLLDWRLAPLWHRIGLFVFRRFHKYYNFAGLRSYKEKFQPVWRSKYLAAPSEADAYAALVDASALVSGGIRGMFGR